MDELKKYENKISEIIAENERKIERCSVRISELKASIEKAAADMITATDNVDVEGYKRAKQIKTESADELEMIEKRLASLQNQPMMNSADYKAFRNNILAEHKKDLEARRKKLLPMIREIQAAGESAAAYDERVDSMLLTLQRKVMRITFKNPLRNASGQEDGSVPVTNDGLDSHPVVWFAQNVKDSAEDNCLI